MVSCPLCQANLDMIQGSSADRPLPIFYFTELLRLAFDADKGISRWFRMHITSPVPLLKSKDLLR